MDQLSDRLSELVYWWDRVTTGIPPEDLAFYTYAGGSVLLLIMASFVLRLFPRTFAQWVWLLLVAILVTPEGTLGGEGFAPASAGVAHAILMKDYSGAANLCLPILAVFVALLVITAIWQMMRGVIETSLARKAEAKQIQEQKQALANAQNRDSLIK